jgi:hypothetical protein
MKKNETDAARRIADEIEGLFKGLDCYQFQTSDSAVYGCEGVLGLRLVGNCLYEHFEEEVIPKDPHWKDRTNATSPRAAKIQKALKKLARETDAWFVLCYELEESGIWQMAWSDQLSPEDAYLLTVQYVRDGMDLWEGMFTR